MKRNKDISSKNLENIKGARSLIKLFEIFQVREILSVAHDLPRRKVNFIGAKIERRKKDDENRRSWQRKIKSLVGEGRDVWKIFVRKKQIS